MKRDVYEARTTCIECGTPLTGHDRGFDTCGDCQHAIIENVRTFDASRLTCATCFHEFDKAHAPCPNCRLLDACQAIIDASNFDDAWHGDGWLSLNPELIERMAVALHAIRRPKEL